VPVAHNMILTCMRGGQVGVLVVGSVALDSVKTPFGAVANVLGGSASYFSTAASFFTDVSLVGVVGDDFPSEALGLFREREINVDGLERVTGKTFRWVGEYSYDLNEAITLDTQLNVF
jgi:sugar/nucleoside kinase (ribokinase family)